MISSKWYPVFAVFCLLWPLCCSQPYSGVCNQNCCCKVCSSPSNEAFPYGLTTVPIAGNPSNPQVQGASCSFPVWSDKAYNDTSGNPVTPPDTIWWTEPSVFTDSKQHTAPFSCDCCLFSGVDTSCSEIRPAATRPRDFQLVNGAAVEYNTATMVFLDGYELSEGDYVELRNDTFCGYTHPRYVLRGTSLTIEQETKAARWVIPRLPSRGCYSVCYFHSNLTTPTWYKIATLTVHKTPQSTVSYVVGRDDVALATNEVTITFFGESLLNVFLDAAEMRTSGSCGGGSPTKSTTVDGDGTLQVEKNAEWCKPPVVPKITAVRPLRYIETKYSDCPTEHRVLQDRINWVLSLPTSATDRTYTICYRKDTVWHSAGTLLVHGVTSAEAALNALYSSTAGSSWYTSGDWGGSNGCTYHGVRCNSDGEVTSIHLSRNNLAGPLPDAFFYGNYFKTLEHLALDMNAIDGVIPHAIGALRNLRFLDLGYNNLEGTVPSSLLSTSIYIMYLSNNNIWDSIPNTLDDLSLLWTHSNQLSLTPPDPVAPGCPEEVLRCSERGSTDIGVTPCGHDGITEAECTIRGCCFNAQAPLVFGGTACFTKQSKHIESHPQCTQDSCSQVVA